MNIHDYDLLVLTYFSARLNKVARVFSEQVLAPPRTSEFNILKDIADPTRIYVGSPRPGGVQPIRAVVYEPATTVEGTVMLVNYQDGWYTMVNILAGELASKVIKVTSSRDDETYPVTFVTVWEDGKEKRIVRSMLDGDRWEFFEQGEIQDFEEPEYYRRRRIASRFNRQILIEYMKKLGIDLESPGFFSSDKLATYFFEQRFE